MSLPFLGEITMFGGNFAPRGWAFCDGQLLPVSQYDALFALLGTIYGGDGRTTFALPDLRGRIPVHQGSGPGLSPRLIGQKYGQETVTLTTNQMPAHSHTVAARVRAESRAANNAAPAGNMVATGATIYRANSPAADVNMSSAMIGVTENNVGSNQPYDIMPPYQAVYYIIALEGVFPSRN